MVRPKVAYVAYTFPVLTQTFTVREVASLRERGLPVRVFSVRRDDDAGLDPLALEEAGRTHYLRGPLSPSGLAALFGWFARRPLRFLGTLWGCLGAGYRDNALSCRLRAPLQFALGAELASILCRDGGYGRVHAQFVDAGSTVAFAASRLADLPFSFTNHTAYNPFLLPLKARHADRVVSISEYDRERVIEDCGEEVRSKIVVNRIGIDIDSWAAVRRRPEPLRALVVGGLREKKGHDVLLEAVGRLAQKGVAVRVRVAGGGAAEKDLQALAARHGARAEFLGPVSPAAVRDELARAAVFVLPCRRAANGDVDGIPVVLMEAMAAGVPVVSTRISGIPELIEDGVSGLLAEPGDVASLAAALQRVLGDAEFARRLGEAGARRVRERHAIEETSSSLAAVLGGADS